MPRLSDTMTEGAISQWLVAEGDEVKRGDILAEIETDKAVMELEAYDAGTLTRILVPAGTTVPIGAPLAVIGDAGEVGSPAADAAPVPAAASPAPAAPAPGAGAAAEVEQASADSGSAAADEVRATPLVRSLARERGIDLTTVHGSGPNGRIIRADLDAVLAGGATASPAAAPTPVPAAAAAPAAAAPPPEAAASTPSAPAAPVAVGTADEVLPLSQIRRVTAQRLTESAAAPHFHVTMPADVTALFAFRAQVNEQLARDGAKVSVTDLLVKACAVALRAHPKVNSSWSGDSIIRRGHVNIGLAVALEEGLIVPVIKDADVLTVRQISERAKDLGERARSGSLKLDEFTGGTFTISNLGMFGVSEFNAVINPPEAAILAVGAAVATPVVVDGALEATTTMNLNLTVDHRVLDGADAARFLRDLVQLLEEPLRIVT